MKLPLVALLLSACVSRSRSRGLCPNPPPVEFAELTNEFITQQSFTVGQYVIYQCLSGYVWNTSTPNVTICQPQLTWSKPLIRCIPKDCGEPPPLLNGNYTVGGYAIGSQARYFCNTGYFLVGKGRSLCTTDGWSKHQQSCQITSCDPPQPISNGSVTQREEWTYRHQANYSCHEGHTLTGEEIIHCTGSGEWSHPPPVCTVTSCDPPQPISNGSVTQREEWMYGHQANYSCHEGHTLTGEETIHCTGSGEWSHPPPVCTVTSCDPPQPISNGSVTQREEWTYGHQANYSCHKGHTLTGEETIHCTGSGEWSHPPPVCTATPEDKEGTTTVHRTTDNRTPSTTPSSALRSLDRALILPSVPNHEEKGTLQGVSGTILWIVLVLLVTLVTIAIIATIIYCGRKQGSYKIG